MSQKNEVMMMKKSSHCYYYYYYYLDVLMKSSTSHWADSVTWKSGDERRRERLAAASCEYIRDSIMCTSLLSAGQLMKK